jgi:hypothetical protein
MRLSENVFPSQADGLSGGGYQPGLVTAPGKVQELLPFLLFLHLMAPIPCSEQVFRLLHGGQNAQFIVPLGLERIHQLVLVAANRADQIFDLRLIGLACCHSFFEFSLVFLQVVDDVLPLFSLFFVNVLHFFGFILGELQFLHYLGFALFILLPVFTLGLHQAGSQKQRRHNKTNHSLFALDRNFHDPSLRNFGIRDMKNFL